MTRFQKLKIWFLALAAIVVLLSANRFVQDRMDTIIKRDKLVDEGSVQGLPPMVAFTTVALGGFRGLLADMLWLRAGRLQEEGKYFELVQLASWLTKLQPKFTAATSYLAWNMAYNISVTFRSQEDRWRWVNRGIELIRDEALNYNPNDPLLYQQLGWIYQHKMGNFLDDAQRYYKFQIAAEMQKAYGGKPGPDWAKLDKAPKSFIEYRKLHPEKAYWEKIARAGYPNEESLNKAFRETGLMPEKLTAALTPAEADELENFLRALWLRDHYRIRPGTVMEIDKKYGALDWRTSESFAIYWATLGIQYSPKKKSVECDRMITQSLKESFLGGRILFATPKPSVDFLLLPNLDTVDAVKQSFDEAYERSGHSNSFYSARENFMIDAAVTLYAYGRYGKSREYFRMLQKMRPGNPKYLNYELFILAQWADDITTGNYRQIQELVSGMIFTSCIYVGYGDEAAAEAHLKMAQLAYNKYVSANKDIDRIKLPPFSAMKNEVTGSVIRNFPQLAPRIRAYVGEEAAARAVQAAEAKEAAAQEKKKQQQ